MGNDIKVGRRKGKKRMGWVAEFPGGPSLRHLGRGLGTKPRLQVRSARAALEERRSWEAGARWGCLAPLRPGARSRAPLTFKAPPARTSGDCAQGARGRAREPGADHRAENATKRWPGLEPALAPPEESPTEQPPGLHGAWGAGSRPRRSRAAAPSPAGAGGARVSGRKRLSHFLQSPPPPLPRLRTCPPSPPPPSPSPRPLRALGRREA